MDGAAQANPKPETIWTLIPRGYTEDKKKMRFTAFVSAAAETAMKPEDSLSGSIWEHWYSNVAKAANAATAARPFLWLEYDGGRLPLALDPNSPSPVASPVVGSKGDLWQQLWNDITRTFPDHLEYVEGAVQATPGHAAAPKGKPNLVLTSFDVNAAAAQSVTASPFEAALDAGVYTTYGHPGAVQTRVQAHAVLADVHTLISPNLAAFTELSAAGFGLRTRVNDKSPKISFMAMDAATRKTLDDVKQKVNDIAVLQNVNGDSFKDSLLAVQGEINKWISPPPVNPMAAKGAEKMWRDLHRLARDPYTQLKTAVLLYVYESRRATFDPQFTRSTDPAIVKVRDYLDQNPYQKILTDTAAFHQRSETDVKASRIPAPKRGKLLQYAPFLKVLSDLGNYPLVLRCLGIAFDVLAEAKSDFARASWARLQLNGATADVLGGVGDQPTTMLQNGPYVLDGGDGVSEFPIQGGFLRLKNAVLVSYDSDGHMMRTIQNAANEASTISGAAGGTAVPAPGPSSSGILPFRNAGLSLRDDDIASILLKRWKRQNDARQASASQKFTAPDLVRGYAPEVLWRGQWFSLTSRCEAYQYRSGEAVTDLLDGPVKDRLLSPIQIGAAYHYDVAPQGGGNAPPPFDPHIAPSLFRWNGWSLGLPDPFDPPQAPPPDANVNNPIVSVITHPLQKEHKLPKLRYGECYEFRVRAVDLAGNGLEAPAAAAIEACQDNLPSGAFLRHDPVLPPVILFDDTFNPDASPGEQIDVMVVRAGDDNYWPIRYLCPPTADLFSLLHQGAFDRSNGHMNSPFHVGSFDDVELDDAGNFPINLFPPVVASSEINQLQVPVYRPPQKQPASGAYLPDLYASFLCVRLVDIATGFTYSSIEKRSFYNRMEEFSDSPERNDYAWPHAGHIRVQLKTSNLTEVLCRWKVDKLQGAPKREALRLEIFVPRGWQLQMLLSCAPTLKQAEKMAARQIAEEHLDAFCQCMEAQGVVVKRHTPEDLVVEHLLASGLSEQYTPSRPVNLVHAVQKPLGGASFIAAANSKPLATSAVIDFTGQIHVDDGRTVGMLNVVLSWDEFRDDPKESSPRVVTHTQIIRQMANRPLEAVLDAPLPTSTPLVPHEIEFPKTSFQFPNNTFRNVQLGVEAISRFQAFYTAPSAIAPGSIAPTDSRFVFPPSKVYAISIQNASVPRPPEISQVLPLMPSVSGPGLFRRIGGALRICLKRGWFSSGAGELLGLVVAPDDLVQCTSVATKAWQIDPQLSAMYTRWGADPMWHIDGLQINNGSNTFAPAPTAADFQPKGVVNFDSPVAVLGMKFQERPTSAATILPYKPVFTPEDGWHCDIILNHIPSYGCFLRLALVRYQPNSIDGMYVSHIATAPFVQLRANRTITVSRSTEPHSHLVAIYGTAPGTSLQGTTEFEVIVEAHFEGGWVRDDKVVLSKAGPACQIPITYDDGTDHPQPLLASYLIEITEHRHRRRKVLVREYEKRPTYDPVTLDDSASVRFLVDTSDAITLVHN